MSLSIKSNSVAKLPFKAKEVAQNEPTVVDRGNYYEKTYTSEATKGKKWGVGLASAFVPGLGQAINGQWGKGIGFFLGTGALYAAGMASGIIGMGGKNPAKGIGAMFALSAGCLGLGIASIVDAVKNAKSEVKQIVPKEESKKVDVQA